jgi:type III secretion protein J
VTVALFPAESSTPDNAKNIKAMADSAAANRSPMNASLSIPLLSGTAGGALALGGGGLMWWRRRSSSSSRAVAIPMSNRK